MFTSSLYTYIWPLTTQVATDHLSARSHHALRAEVKAALKRPTWQIGTLSEDVLRAKQQATAKVGVDVGSTLPGLN